MEFTVRPMAESDWEKYREIRLEMLSDTPLAYIETLESAQARSESEWRERLAASTGLDSIRFAAILPSGAWVGAMGGFIEKERGPVLVGVYVAPRYRGDDKGVTSALMDVVEGWARRTSPVIHLDVHQDNARARAAYVKRGYVETGHTIPYPLDPSQLEVEMVKRLG